MLAAAFRSSQQSNTSAREDPMGKKQHWSWVLSELWALLICSLLCQGADRCHWHLTQRCC